MNQYHHGAQFSNGDQSEHHRENPNNLHEPYENNSPDDEEDDVSCAKCQRKPEDVLILTCDHNLCLECAALNLEDQTTQNQNTFKTVICEYCQSATVLDPESATELIEIAQQILESQARQSRQDAPQTNNNHQHQHLSADFRRATANGQQHGRNQQVNMSHRGAGGQRPQQQQTNSQHNSNTMNSSYRPVRDFCKDHPEEEVSYFCHGCMTAPVCSECVIHGAHQGHNVALLKKAHPSIVKDLEDLQIQVSAKIDDLALQEQRFEARKREISEQNQNAKQYMANSFEELIRRIKQKEREMLNHCDQKATELVAELDGSTRLIKGRMQHLSEAVEEINVQIMQEYDVAVATYYAENYDNLSRSCLMDSELPQMKDLPEKVNFQAKLDMSSLDQFLKDMESVHVCLENLEGVRDGDLQQRRGGSGSKQNRNHSKGQNQQMMRRNPTQSAMTDKQLTTHGDDQIDSKSMQQLTHDPSSRSVFQVAYSQKSEKQGGANGHGGPGNQGNATNPLQVSVQQTMQQLHKQKQQQAQAFFQNKHQHHQVRAQRSDMNEMGVPGQNESDNEPEF